jgi:poly(beta-D-mannuronate) lyase
MDLNKRKHISRWPIQSVLLALLLLYSLPLQATDQSAQVSVDSIAELEEAVSRAHPGDVIILKAGQYDQKCTLSAKGTAVNPIEIRSQSMGKTNIRNVVTLNGEFFSLVGFNFTGNGSVKISGRGIRVSRCRMSNVRTGKWIQVAAGSYKVEIDHCLFEKKDINRKMKRGCQLIQIVVLNKKEKHHIHHNHFRDIPKGGGNGFETLQLITRGNPFDPPAGHCETLIEDNLFERCNGESEIISIKSNGNIIRRNTFRACNGSLVFRHGDSNVAAGNFFLGTGEKGSGGVRLQGTDHVVANNYFHGLANFGVTMMDGTPDNLYVRVERANILFNTFVNCKYALVVGANHSKHPNGTVPRQCVIANNIFFAGKDGGSEEKDISQAVKLVQDDQPEEWNWVDNIVQGKLGISLTSGIRSQDPHLRFLKNGLAIPTDKTPSAKQLVKDLRWTEVDLFATTRGGRKTTGAVQFPVKSLAAGPLTEKMVGPDVSDLITNRIR